MYRFQDIKIKMVRQLPWVWSSVRISYTEYRLICVLDNSQPKYKILPHYGDPKLGLSVYSGYQILLRLSEFIYLIVQRPFIRIGLPPGGSGGHGKMNSHGTGLWVLLAQGSSAKALIRSI